MPWLIYFYCSYKYFVPLLNIYIKTYGHSSMASMVCYGDSNGIQIFLKCMSSKKRLSLVLERVRNDLNSCKVFTGFYWYQVSITEIYH